MNADAHSRSDWRFLGGLALLKVLIHLPVLGRYGYHHDELYFLACGHHLAFGYVDHPPLVPWIAGLADTLFGQSLFGLRLAPLLAGTAAVFVTGVLTRRLGGGRFAQLTACLAMIVAPVYLRTANLLCIPAFEPLWWVLCSYLLVRIIQEDNPRLWLWIGLVVGVGLLTKHSTLFFAFGLAVGLVLTPQRKYLGSPWLYGGGALALLIFAPNILWQIANGWPTVEFLRHLNAGTMGGIAVAEFLAGQIMYLQPFAAPVWIAGLVFFFAHAGKPYRLLGWIYVAVFVLLVLIKSKIYYLAPAYPALLAGGGVLFERLATRTSASFPRKRESMETAPRPWMPAFAGMTANWFQLVIIGTLAVTGVLLAPLSLPILPIDLTDRYITALTFGAFGNVYELTGDLHGQFGWRERVAIVAKVYNSLPPAERERTAIYASWYGPAAAVDYFGAAYGLPHAVSGFMTYYLWGPPPGPISTVIAVDERGWSLRDFFEEGGVAAEVELPNVNPWERKFTVAVYRKPTVDLRAHWPETRHW